MKEDENNNEDEDGDIKDVHWEALEEVHQVAPSGKTALRAHIFQHAACIALDCTEQLCCMYTTLHYYPHWISAVGGGRNTSQHNMAYFSSDFSFKVTP